MKKLKPSVIVGFRISPDTPVADFYTILWDDGEYMPLDYKGQLLFFSDMSDVDEVRTYINTELNTPADIGTELYTVYDIVRMFHLFYRGEEDPYACIVNNLNLLLDMLKTASVHMPFFYNDVLCSTADYFTFSTDINQYIKEEEIDRTDLIESVQWAIGAVMSRGIFLPKREEMLK